MDTSSRRPQLPALSYLDVGDLKREETTYQDRKLGPPTAAASPTYQYPSGPPPPYNSHHAQSSGSAWPAIKPGVQTPPESRRTSGDDHDGARVGARQSLPSISEALGVDGHTPYQVVPSHVPVPRSPAPASPTSGSRRLYGAEVSQPQQHYASQPGQLSSFRQDSAGPQSYPSQERGHTSQDSTSNSRPSLQIQAASPTPRLAESASHAHPPTSGTYENSSSSPGSMPPPPSTFGYGYTNHTPRYAQPNPSPSQSHGPIYSPSAQYGPPPPTASTSWRADPTRYGADERAPQIYGDSVKRHIDLYDFEAALSEVERSSTSLTDFARRYGVHMHQQARTGPSLATLPSIIELDDMMNKSRLQMDSLAKIREVVIAQQAVYEQQAADQRQQHKVYADAPAMPSGPSMEDDIKAGFANGDTKKRRGRAAPPGRCHSCNRAETPEWRRGPDGARTLCNACGLHYAKLTRKNQSGAGKTSQAGSSNLRPKE